MKLKDGTSSLADGQSQLLDGQKQLAEGAAKLADGVSTLDSGAASWILVLRSLPMVLKFEGRFVDFGFGRRLLLMVRRS